MTSYNKVNGTYTSDHRYLPNEVLKGAWEGLRDVRFGRGTRLGVHTQGARPGILNVLVL
jgi:hypothetical protein